MENEVLTVQELSSLKVDKTSDDIEVPDPVTYVSCIIHESFNTQLASLLTCETLLPQP